jgi:hypothetical protein
MHPAEMLGDDWYMHGDWGLDVPEDTPDPSCAAEPRANSLR